MAQTLLFLAFSLVAVAALILVSVANRNTSFRNMLGLFLFGGLISLPFVMIEHLGLHMKFYIVILTFIAIELAVLYFENRIQYFHHLIQHNIKDMRIVSFFLIGLGFTYSEIVFTIFSYHGPIAELVGIIPLKTVYSLLIHTVLTSIATLVSVGNLFAETVYETVFKLIAYYLRITVIGVSHYLYSFSLEHNIIYLMVIVLTGGTLAFFYTKKKLDSKAMMASL